MKMMKKHSILKLINNSLIDLPSPVNISTWWNFGSLLGLFFTIQLITGLFLTMHYCPNIYSAFDSIIHISRNVNLGWMARILHANGASLIFILMYIHIARGMFFGSYLLKETWTIGIIILFSMMATAFLGYVLPWGQMSFWGATVITNLLSAIPYVGSTIVNWLWGGFAISNATLNRFFALHFLMPFIITALIISHLIFLHQTGSSNPLGTNSNMNKIPFHPYFSFKDSLTLILMIMSLIMITTLYPYWTSDPDNFIQANPLVTPAHIKPEWYFLFAYAMLRSIPNKLGGVLVLFLSISILLVLPMTSKKIQSNSFYPMNKILFWFFIMVASLLTWIGARPVEEPFILTGQILTILYFSFFPLNFILFKIWDKLLKF